MPIASRLAAAAKCSGVEPLQQQEKCSVKGAARRVQREGAAQKRERGVEGGVSVGERQPGGSDGGVLLGSNEADARSL